MQKDVEDISREIDPADDPHGSKRLAQQQHYFVKFYGTVEERHQNFMKKQIDDNCGAPVIRSSELSLANLRKLIEEEEEALQITLAEKKRLADEEVERRQAEDAARLYKEAVNSRGKRADGSVGAARSLSVMMKKKASFSASRSDLSASLKHQQPPTVTTGTFQRYHLVETAVATGHSRALNDALVSEAAIEQHFLDQQRFRYAISSREEDEDVDADVDEFVTLSSQDELPQGPTSTAESATGQPRLASKYLQALRFELDNLTDDGLVMAPVKQPLAHPMYPCPANGDTEANGILSELNKTSPSANQQRFRPRTLAEPFSVHPAPTNIEHSAAIKLCQAKERYLPASTDGGGSYRQNSRSVSLRGSRALSDTAANNAFITLTSSAAASSRATPMTDSSRPPKGNRKKLALKAGPSAILSQYGFGRKQSSVDLEGLRPLMKKKKTKIRSEGDDFSSGDDEDDEETEENFLASEPLTEEERALVFGIPSHNKQQQQALPQSQLLPKQIGMDDDTQSTDAENQLLERKGTGVPTRSDTKEDESAKEYDLPPPLPSTAFDPLALEASVLAGLHLSVLHHDIEAQQAEDFVNKVDNKWLRRSEGLSRVHEAVRSNRRAAEVDVEEALFRQSSDDSDGYDEDVQKEWREETSGIFAACRALEYRGANSFDVGSIASYVYSNGYSGSAGQVGRPNRATASTSKEDGFDRFVQMLRSMSDATIAAKKAEQKLQADIKMQVWSEGLAQLKASLAQAASNGATSAELSALQQTFLQTYDADGATAPKNARKPPLLEIFTPSEEHMVWDAIRFMFRDCEPLHHKKWLSGATKLSSALNFADRPPIACVVYVLDAIVALQYSIDQRQVESAKLREQLWGERLLNAEKVVKDKTNYPVEDASQRNIQATNGLNDSVFSQVNLTEVDVDEGETDGSQTNTSMSAHTNISAAVAALTDKLLPPLDALAPAFPACNLIRPHHMARVERWLSRSSYLVRKRIAVLQSLGVSEPTWAQLNVSAGGADRNVKAATLTLGDAATANVKYLQQTSI